GSSDSLGSEVTGPPAHATASVSPNSASPHRRRHPCQPARNAASCCHPAGSPRWTTEPSHAILTATATASSPCSCSEREDDQAVATPCHGDTPDKINDPGSPGQPRVKTKVKSLLENSRGLRSSAGEAAVHDGDHGPVD